MFSFYSLKRSANLSGVNVTIRLHVDCEHKEGSFSISINGRIVRKQWNDPKWWEVDTPAKAEAWFRRVDMDSVAWNYRNHAA